MGRQQLQRHVVEVIIGGTTFVNVLVDTHTNQIICHYRTDRDGLLQELDKITDEEKKKSSTISTLNEQITDLSTRLLKKNETIDEVSGA